jgi:transcriptional regulator with XRE-family HTH domain
MQKMSTAERERFGATLRALRESMGWEPDRFASACDKSRSHIANIEAGRKQPPPSLIRRMAEVLGVPLAALISAEYNLTAEDQRFPRRTAS